MHRKTLRLATRQSPLALAQAALIKQALEMRHQHVDVEIIAMTTEGDRILDQPLAKIGGKGLFTAELEKALRDEDVDVAVHSMKDLPVQIPDGLAVPVITAREDPRDVFISAQYQHVSKLPKGAVIGTASLRRQCQVLAQYPTLKVTTLRGNLGTRLAKLAAGEVDAIILASAGVNRLNLNEHIRHHFETDEMLPAVGQGALGLECRADDKDTIHLLQGINCESTHACVAAERAVNQRLEGSCQAPLAMYAQRFGPTLSLHALVGKPDGSVILRAASSGNMMDPHSVGRIVAEDLLAQGARDILDECAASYADLPEVPSATDNIAKE